MKKTILSLKYDEAKEFFFKDESYVNIDFPPYIKFETLLIEISKELKDKDYFGIKTKSPNNIDNLNYKFMHNKNGKYDWRPLQIIHPVIYVSLINQITNYRNWKELKKRFGEIRGKSIVECISLPIVSETKQSDKAEQILNWWEEIEQKSISLSLDFSYIYHTDISDCYGSIYTHSIPWAIHSKEMAKKYKPNTSKGKKLIGNIVDRHIQAMSYGQTNGIPQGSVLMDFIAEIVLNYADLLLSKKIKATHINKKDFKILRYRDDYRIFVNSPSIADEIIKNLTEVLIELGLKLHSQKTLNYNNVIYGSIKQDKISWLIEKSYVKTIQKELLILHNFSKDFSNSGVLLKELQNILKKVNKQTKTNKKKEKFKKKENLEVLISIVTDIAYSNPRTYSIAMAFLSKLFDLLDDINKVECIVNKISKKFETIPNTGHMKIWLQRAIIKSDIDIEFREDICQVISGCTTISLWKNDWLPPKYKKIIEDNSIYDEVEFNNMDTIINIDEVKIFGY